MEITTEPQKEVEDDIKNNVSVGRMLVNVLKKIEALQDSRYQFEKHSAAMTKEERLKNAEIIEYKTAELLKDLEDIKVARIQQDGKTLASFDDCKDIISGIVVLLFKEIVRAVKRRLRWENAIVGIIVACVLLVLIISSAAVSSLLDTYLLKN